MNNKNLRQYISFIKTRFPKISEMMIEKDYYLSLFLTKAQELKNKNKLKEFDNLIFKGGTLLNKLYLNYHRISEDLDFNHIKSNSIRDLSSTNKIGKCIKKIELDLIDDIKEISDTCGFDFKINRSPVAGYIKVINKRILCTFNVYYKSLYLSSTISKLKIEVNFVEERLFDYHIKNLLNLVDILDLSNIDKKELYSLNFNLDTVKLKVYDINEIILEKYRALLTRKKIKERDLFDLFLINNKINVLDIDLDEIISKIKSASKYFMFTKINFNINLKLFKEDSIVYYDNILDLCLIKYNIAKYSRFKSNIVNKIKNLNYL